MPVAIRQTVDYSQYPDLVVIYLGMRMESLKGLRTIAALGPQIQKSVDEKPDGLLLHEPIWYSLFPPHPGMRQYWRDFESLEKWTRALPHKKWWGDFLRADSGVGFWHEAYSARHGFEGLYSRLSVDIGLLKVGKPIPAEGPMLGARGRLKLPEKP
jgi:hypothetical protein